MVISPNKWEEKIDEIPIKVIQINKEQIKQSTAQTSADLLKKSNQVYIQKNQLRGGSPMIRGFAANRLLIVIRISNKLEANISIENLFNKRYRPYSSGISAGGSNFVLGVSYGL